MNSKIFCIGSSMIDVRVEVFSFDLSVFLVMRIVVFVIGMIKKCIVDY